jgi:hypothetical protein
LQRHGRQTARRRTRSPWHGVRRSTRPNSSDGRSAQGGDLDAAIDIVCVGGYACRDLLGFFYISDFAPSLYFFSFLVSMQETAYYGI